MRKVIKFSLLALALLGIGGCGGEKTPPKTTVFATEIKTPWDEFCNRYMNMEGGVTACECVFAVDLEDALDARTRAVNRARGELATQLKARVKRMVKDYIERVQSGKKIHKGSVWEQAAITIANEYLRGSRPIKFATFRTSDGKYVSCSVVAIQPSAVREMIDKIADAGDVPPRDRDLLYEEFKAWKAFKELEQKTTDNPQ